MPSTYATLLRTEQQASGENNNTWGTKANVVFTLLEEGIAGMESMAVTGGSKTLTATNGASDESRNMILKFTGTLASDQTVIVPSTSKIYVVWNATSGDYTLTVKTAAGTGIVVGQDETTFLFCDGTNVYSILSEPLNKGKHTIWIPAAAMKPSSTSGSNSLENIEVSAGNPSLLGLAFDKDADEYAEFFISLPKSWDDGTVTFKPYWTANDVSTNGVAWGLQGVSLGDNEALASSYGTAVVVTDDNQGSSYRVLVGAESAAVTLAGTAAESELQAFRVFRDVSDAADDLAADAYLIGIQLFVTLDLANDE